MCGKETVQYGRPRRRRHEAWIYRRSTRIVPLLLRGKEKTDRAEDAGRVLNELGLSEIVTAPGCATATLGDVAVEKIVPNLVNACVPVLGFAVLRPSLEDVFVSLTGEGFDVSG